MSLVLDEHREYLADTARVGAFDRALARIIKPGDTVLDLASGTGILGWLACRHGARHVYAVDTGSIVGLARELARANGLADRVTIIRGLSTRVDLPERVDVVVTDQIGRIGFEAGLLEYISDARARLLTPGGRIVPAAIDFCVAAIEASDARAAIDFWTKPAAGFEVSAAHLTALNTGYPIAATADQLLSAPAPIVSVDLSSAKPEPLRGDVELVVTRDGVLDGLLAGFVATLAPAVTMSNLPTASDPIKRRTAFLPIAERAAVRAGDRVGVTLRVLPADLIVNWSLSLPDGRRFSHSTMHGMLLSSEDLAKTRRDFVPSLTAWGRARQSVLELCDGRRSIGDIECAVRSRHPDLFRTPADAEAFVAEVMVPYAANPPHLGRRR